MMTLPQLIYLLSDDRTNVSTTTEVINDNDDDAKNKGRIRCRQQRQRQQRQSARIHTIQQQQEQKQKQNKQQMVQKKWLENECRPIVDTAAGCDAVVTDFDCDCDRPSL